MLGCALTLIACNSERATTPPPPPPPATASSAAAPAASSIDALALRIVQLEARVDRLEATMQRHEAAPPSPMQTGSAASPSMGMGNMDKVPMDKPAMEHPAMGGAMGSNAGSGAAAPSTGEGHM